jgi:hypothetical protein
VSPRERSDWEKHPIIGRESRTTVISTLDMVKTGASFLLMAAFLLIGSPHKGEWSRLILIAMRAAGVASMFGAVSQLTGAAINAWGARAKLDDGSPDAWTLDHGWTPGESRDGAVADACGAAFFFAITVAGLGFALVYAVHAANESILVRLAAVALAAAFVAGASTSAARIRRGVVFGESILRWDGGPLRAGASWTGTVEVPARVTAPRANLRFISEQEDDGGKKPSFERKAFDRVGVKVTIEYGSGGRKLLRLTSAIPAEAPSTALSARPARYWELFITDEASRWTTSFLLPIYR